MATIIFDVYGTLIDVHGVAETAEQRFPGYGASLSALWRQKQIDYTRLRTLGGRHRDFDALTADALDFAMERLGLGVTAAIREELLAAYDRLPAFADVAPALHALAAAGHRLGVLSNGTPPSLERVLGAAGLRELLAFVLSIETAGRFKVAPEAYRLAVDATGERPEDIIFVSANGWDVAGAGWFGLTAFWVNRAAEPPERLGIAPAGEGRSLADLVRWMSEGAA